MLLCVFWELLARLSLFCVLLILSHKSIFKMAEFGLLNGPVADDDKIVIHLGHLTQAQYDKVVESVIAFMNQRWPNLMHVGEDS